MAETPDTTTRPYYRGNGTRYEHAKQHIEETTENIFTERKWWRRGNFVQLGLIVVLVVAVVILAQRPAYEPIYITQNTEGQLRTLKWEEYNPEIEEIKGHLFRWMRCMRGLPTSEPIIDYCWKIVPLFLLEKTQAVEVVKAFYKSLEPKKLLFHKEIDLVDMKGHREPDGRWRLAWTEDVYTFRERQGIGKKESSTQMSAVLTVTRRKPVSRKAIELNGEIVNPIGLYVTQLGWGG